MSKKAKHTDHVGQFEVICEENNRQFSREVIDDPFVYTRIRPRGWRAAWEVLRGRYELAVRVRGLHNAVYRAVITADYTPDPSPESPIPPRKPRAARPRGGKGT